MRSTFKVSNRVTTAASLLLAATLLQACASHTLKQVSEKNKDATGKYDGKWLAIVENTARTQHLNGNWEISCNDLTGEKMPLIVENGIISMSSENEAYVNPIGKFRVEVPLAVKAAAAGTSDSTISNGSMTIILQGSLEHQKGLLTYGIAEFGNNGCTSKIKYQKL